MSGETLSEFRQDLVSGAWVLFSTKRSQRPHAVKKVVAVLAPKESCPFEDFEKSGNEVIWRYPEGQNVTVTLIKNKFPAVEYGFCTPTRQKGPFQVHDAVGQHELFVLKDHDTPLADLSLEDLTQLVRAYKKRKKEIVETDNCAKYVLIFHNSGADAGASIYHPHSQLLSTPILPPDVSRSFHGAQRFFEKHGKRVYDVLIDWEKEQDIRIILESEHFIAFCPFVSQSPYEVRIFSKESHAHFEHMPSELDAEFAGVFSTVLKKIKGALNNPSFNFFLHSAPSDNELVDLHEFYNWHMEITPVISVHAGFEGATGVMINSVDPDMAAKLLRETDV